MNIPDHHIVSMESTIRNHATVTMGLLRRCYAVAKAEIDQRPEAVQGIMPSRLEVKNAQHGDVIIGTGTDEQTGIYVQLAKTNAHLLLTIGQKWAIQQPNAQGTLVTAHR